MTTQHWLSTGQTQLAIDPDECWTLVESQDVGRIGFVALDRVQVLPVSYSHRGRRLYLRTAPDGVIARHVDGVQVSVEVDQLDPVHRSGWSVLVAGVASRIRDSDALAEQWTPDPPQPWAGGGRNVWFRIRVDEVTGRRFGPYPASGAGA